MTSRRRSQRCQVEVYAVELTQPPEDVARLEALLSADERARAARLAHPRPWIVARGALRTVLGMRLGIDPSEVVFDVGRHGKPELPGASLRFNLSHSGERALLAVALDAEVGIDIERTNRRSRVIERTLTDGERARLDDGQDRHLQLLRIWCRKEALAKALGGGLGWAPEEFDTSAAEGHVLVDLDPGPGYVGALAVASDAVEVEQLAFSACAES